MPVVHNFPKTSTFIFLLITEDQTMIFSIVSVLYLAINNSYQNLLYLLDEFRYFLRKRRTDTNG